MPRQVRIEFPGAVYHAMARGDRREDIVRDDGDREAFVSLLGELEPPFPRPPIQPHPCLGGLPQKANSCYEVGQVGV